MNTKELQKEINAIKKERDAIVLVHNYQPTEIQDIADFTGDSLDLSYKARDAKEDVIVFCGVHFMADTAKILSPQKTILNPNPKADCPMARMIDEHELKTLKKKNPKALVMCYVNSTAEVKAESDICCTSSNAHILVNKLDCEEVIFVPDRNLASFVQRHTKKKIIPGEGYCYVHDNITTENISEARKKHPEALVIVHPECRKEVVDMADHAASTQGMISLVTETKNKTYIIGTEVGLIHRLKKIFAEKDFYSPGIPHVCVNMKKISQKDVYKTLINMEPQVSIQESIRKKAFESLDKMLNLSK